jgi:hypothetical protein
MSIAPDLPCFFDDLPRFWNGVPLNGESENDGCDVLQKNRDLKR